MAASNAVHLREPREADVLNIVENTAAVDALTSIGLTGTSSVAGAGSSRGVIAYTDECAGRVLFFCLLCSTRFAGASGAGAAAAL